MIDLRTSITETLIRLITVLPPASASLSEEADWVSQFNLHGETLQALNGEVALEWSRLTQQHPQLEA